MFGGSQFGQRRRRTLFKRFLVPALVVLFDIANSEAWENSRNGQVLDLPGPVISAQFTYDAATKKVELVVCDAAGAITVMDIAGKQLRRWNAVAAKQNVTHFTISPDGSASAVMTAEGALTLRRLVVPETVTDAKPKFIYPRIAISRDGAWVAAFGGPAVQTWNIATGVENRLPPHLAHGNRNDHEMLGFLTISDDYYFVSTGFHCPTVTMWAMPTGEKIRDFSGDEQIDRKFIDLATSPDSRWIVAVTAASHRLAIWDVGSGKIAARPNAFPTGVGNRLAFSGNGQCLVCSKHLHSPQSPTGFRLYRVATWEEMHHLFVTENRATPQEWESIGIIDIAIDHSGSTVITRHGDGKIRLWATP